MYGLRESEEFPVVLTHASAKEPLMEPTLELKVKAREVSGRGGDGIADPIPGMVGIRSLPVPKDA